MKTRIFLKIFCPLRNLVNDWCYFFPDVHDDFVNPEIAENNDNEEWKLMKKYFYKKYTYEEICGVLKSKHNIRISVRTLKRKLKQKKLKRKNIIESPPEEIMSAIINEVFGEGCNLGYRAMWYRLQKKYQITAKQKTVLEILRFVDPEGVEQRSRYRLRRRQYISRGPNFIWHTDGHDKVKRFGFAIHGCIDGFSKKLIWLKVGTSNNDPHIIAGYYLEAVSHFEILPAMLRADHGSENSTIELLQMAMRQDHNDEYAGSRSFLYGKSTANQRIESYWGILRQQVFFINIFKIMEANHSIDVSNPFQIDLLRFCFGSIVQQGIELIKREWNDHRIRKQNNRNINGGIPNVLYYWPERYKRVNHGKTVNLEGIEHLRSSYVTESKLYSDNIEELIHLLMPNVRTPRNCEEAYDLFNELVKMSDRYINTDN